MSKQIWEEVMDFIDEDGTAIVNSITETIVFPDYTIPAKYVGKDRVLLYEAFGRYSTTGTPTLRFRLRWGGVAGTAIWDSGTITGGSGVTAALWWVRVWIQFRAGGSTAGSVFCVGHAWLGSALAPTVGSATGAPGAGIFGSAGDDTPAAIGSLNTLADTLLSLTALWSAQSASNTITGHFRSLESKN